MAVSDVNKQLQPVDTNPVRPGTAKLLPMPTTPMLGGGAASGGSPGYDMINQLKALRQKLEAGQISVAEFTAQGQPIAEAIYNEQLRLGAGGSASAQQGDKLRAAFDSADTGFRQEDAPTSTEAGSRAHVGTKLALPEKYQAQVRDNQLPDNFTPEQKQQYKDQIPSDIQVGTDRFDIEREGLRQRMEADDLTNKQQGLYAQAGQQQKGELDAEGLRQKGLLDTLHSTQNDQRGQSLSDLATLLHDQDNRQFKLAIPGLAEDANTKGIFRSTGFGDSLAREFANLTATTDEKLRNQGIADRNTYIDSASSALDKQLGYNDQGVGAQQTQENAGMQDLIGSQKASLDRQLGYQGAGLDRQFSVEDAGKNMAQMKSLAELAQPQQSGKSGAETAATVAGLGVNGAKAYYGAGGAQGK